MSGERLTTNKVYPKVIMISLGDMESGFTFYGPFVSPSAAKTWQLANVKDGEIVKRLEVNDVTPQETCCQPAGGSWFTSRGRRG